MLPSLTIDLILRTRLGFLAVAGRASAQLLRSKGMTVKAIADRLGVSDERVRQLLLEAEPSMNDA